jgi:hypothetical protein
MTAISTEGRIFVARLTRDLAARESAGAALLSSGTKRWREAFRSFGYALSKSAGPVKAAKMFKAGLAHLRIAQKQQRACYVNAYMGRSRSGYFEVLTWEVSKHPLTNAGYEGVIVRSYDFLLQRTGRILVGQGSKLAFLSWHALARMYERSEADIFDHIVAGCGMAGLLMRESDKHANTGINYATNENLLCAGVLRVASNDDGTSYGFFDVLTAFQPNEEGPQAEQWKQGCAVAWAVNKYAKADDSDPSGYADKIPVLPFDRHDHVSRTLTKMEADNAQP